MGKIRLDKFLADMGTGTRSQVKEFIRRGQVTVNGETAKRPELKVDPDEDQVCLQERTLTYQKHRYVMLHKPAGLVSATEDAREGTVLELLPAEARRGLFPVGRLDKDTEGLLLLTDDGELAHRLLSPRKHVDKKYFARVAGRITGEDVRAFSRGMDIGDEKLTLPAVLTVLSEGEEASEVTVTLREGRYHQIKRMFEAIGSRVLYLKRISMGPLLLDDDLKPGEYRELTREERALLGRPDIPAEDPKREDVRKEGDTYAG